MYWVTGIEVMPLVIHQQNRIFNPALILGAYIIMILTDRGVAWEAESKPTGTSRQQDPHPKAYQLQLHIRALPNRHDLVPYPITPDVIVL